MTAIVKVVTKECCEEIITKLIKIYQALVAHKTLTKQSYV